jgi:transcriptional regulator with XRE-family HTH domain
MIGKKLKLLMLLNGYNTKDLAAMMGVSQPSVSDWVNNKKNPTIKRLRKLSDIFNKPIEYFLDENISESDIEKESNLSPEDKKLLEIIHRYPAKTKKVLIQLLMDLAENEKNLEDTEINFRGDKKKPD